MNMSAVLQTYPPQNAYAAIFPADHVQEQAWLLQYAPLVRRIVRQLLSQLSGAMGRDDFEQIGLMGLLEALRRYGTPDENFSSYAALRIRGAILDELRRQDWRPRTIRQQTHRYAGELRELTRALGREPTAQEATAALGISLEEYQQYELDELAGVVRGFEEVMADLAEHANSTPGPEERAILHRSLQGALAALDTREQRIIQLIYEHELSYKEIAAVLAISDARVCQLKKIALKKMRRALLQK